MNTQKEYISKITKEILEECAQKLSNKYDEIKKELTNDITSRIKNDVYDKINGPDIKLKYKNYNHEYKNQNSIIKCSTVNQPHISEAHQWTVDCVNVIDNVLKLKLNENIIYHSVTIEKNQNPVVPDQIPIHSTLIQ